MRKTKSLINNLDWPLFIGFISLIVFGLITIYSVAFNEEHPNIFSFSEKYGKQIMWIGIALFLGFMVFLIYLFLYRYILQPQKIKINLYQMFLVYHLLCYTLQKFMVHGEQ